jgi:hypothetical protein
MQVINNTLNLGQVEKSSTAGANDVVGKAILIRGVGANTGIERAACQKCYVKNTNGKYNLAEKYHIPLPYVSPLGAPHG